MPEEDGLAGEVRGALAPYVGSGELPGGALCVLRRGEVLLEVCVGTVDGSRPWRTDTLVMCFSVAKPVAALALLVVMAEHGLGLDDRVAEVWPEYGVAGKETTTLRHLLRHASGLHCFPPEAASLDPGDTAALVDLLAAATPLHEPGTAFGEHAATYGHLLGEVVRRVAGESLESRWARIARAAGWDLHLRVDEQDEDRVATVVPVADDWPSRYVDDPRWAPALVRLPGLVDADLLNTREWRTTPFAAINLHASARGIAAFFDDLPRADGVIAGLLGPELFAEYTAPQSVGHDLVLDREVTWTLGPQRDEVEVSMGGAGGCAGWFDLAGGYGAGWVTRGLGSWAPLDALDPLVQAAFR
jgi:CubicO group peptidase (beta-lactamase class C family)